MTWVIVASVVVLAISAALYARTFRPVGDRRREARIRYYEWLSLPPTAETLVEYLVTLRLAQLKGLITAEELERRTRRLALATNNRQAEREVLDLERRLRDQ